MNKILVVAAHPDDEVLGCSGTIAKMVKSKKAIAKALIISEGLTARENKKFVKSKKYFNKLYAASKKSAKIIGYSSIEILSYPDNKLDTVPNLEIIKAIEKKIKSFKPNIVFTHSGTDLNIDHQLVSRAVITATRPLKKQSVKKVLAFETVSSTEWSFNKKKQFLPNYFENITNYINIKKRALKAYSSEMRKFPHPRSEEAIIALAKFRGSSSGFNLAEAFEVIREIKD